MVRQAQIHTAEAQCLSLAKPILVVDITFGCLMTSVAGAEVITESFGVRAANVISIEDSLPRPVDEIIGSFAVTSIRISQTFTRRRLGERKRLRSRS